MAEAAASFCMHSMDAEDSSTTTSEPQPQPSPSPFLSPEHRDVTILSLRMSSRRRLGMFLNDPDALPNHAGLLPNYQGLAELIGFEFIEQLSFQRQRDPTMALLLEWGSRGELNPKLGDLVEYLSQLERLDVLEDCREMIRNDAEHYLKKKAAGFSEFNPVQDSTVSQSPFNIDDMNVDETAIMTIQDVEAGKPTYYDAFVCYHPEGDDLKFVRELITRVEAPPYNLRLFVPHRDDLAGASKHTISAKLIQDRCRRMVIVMSPRYLRSDACDFQTKFAHALSPGSRSKKLVPVLIQYCSTPNILRHVTICDYSRGDMTGWFWDRLIKSLQAPLNPSDITIDTATDLSALKLNIRGAEGEGEASPAPPTFSRWAEPAVVAPPSFGQGVGSTGVTPPKGAEPSPVSPPAFSSSPSSSGSPLKPTSLRRGSGSPTKTGWGESGGGVGGGSGTNPSSSGRSTPTPETPAGGKKKGFPTSPLSSSPSSSTPPSSPSTERKGSGGGGGAGGQQKKKGLKSKLTSVFSSSHSSSC